MGFPRNALWRRRCGPGCGGAAAVVGGVCLPGVGGVAPSGKFFGFDALRTTKWLFGQ